MCSSIPEDSARQSQCIDEVLDCTENIVEMLDYTDYPSNLILKSLFVSFFQRLSAPDQEALVNRSADLPFFQIILILRLPHCFGDNQSNRSREVVTKTSEEIPT